MADTFNWICSIGSIERTIPKVLKAPFGDGYSQRAPDGLNSLLRVWDVQLNNRSSAECDAIIAFLRAQGGCLSFNWTPPSGDAALWVCSIPNGWTRTPQNGPLGSITCTFEEVPA
jgi:phage-related protein